MMVHGLSISWFQAWQQCSTISASEANTRLESQLSRRYCQTFSVGLTPDWIRGGRFRRQRQQTYVGGDIELAGGVPAGLIEQNHRVRARGNGLGDLRQLQQHGGGIAERQHQGGPGSACRADGAEDAGRAGALIAGRRRPRAALRPASGDPVLLPDPGLVVKPDLYRFAGCIRGRDFRQASGKVFLKAATASGSWA